MAFIRQLGIGYKEGGGPRGQVRVVVNPKDLERAEKLFNTYRKQEYSARAVQIFYSGAKMMERPLKAAAPLNRWPDPVGSTRKRKRGSLRASMMTRKNNLRFGELAAATTGTVAKRAPHRYLVVRGTSPHSLFPKKAGKKELVSFVPRSRKVNTRKSAKRSWIQDSYVARNGVMVMRLSKKSMHPGAKPTPFVNMVMPLYEPRVINFIEQKMVKLGSSPLYSGAVAKGF